MKTQIYVVYK